MPPPAHEGTQCPPVGHSKTPSQEPHRTMRSTASLCAQGGDEASTDPRAWGGNPHDTRHGTFPRPLLSTLRSTVDMPGLLTAAPSSFDTICLSTHVGKLPGAPAPAPAPVAACCHITPGLPPPPLPLHPQQSSATSSCFLRARSPGLRDRLEVGLGWIHTSLIWRISPLAFFTLLSARM